MTIRPLLTARGRYTISLLISASVTWAADLAPLPNFAVSGPGQLQIIARALPESPWTVAGEYGALFGRQNGKFEAWQWPLKILSNFSIRAEVADYSVPIDANALAAEIKVTPAETVITYSHAAFTIRQHMFATRGARAAPSVAAAVFFEFASARPLDITFSFTPEMLRMWPAPNFGRPNGEWTRNGKAGFYVLHTDDPNFSAVVAMPRSQPGILVPYQEHPQTYPLELKLSFDPKSDTGQVFPLLISSLGKEKPDALVSDMMTSLPQLYKQTEDYYDHFLHSRTSAETPDRSVNEALAWAEISIDQMQVNYHGETGMAAGYYESADSARPGYAWFFGRDTLWTTYAINSYGDFAVTRRALDFLLARQRDDGKIMHEYSQSADALDWNTTPYFYASADATCLIIMAMWDYIKASGDLGYLRKNWEAINKAYAFIRAHEAKNGVYNNSEGTGWVESWPPTMPYQEVYLAALDQQSCTAMSGLASLMGNSSTSDSAHKKAEAIRKVLDSDFFNAHEQFYSFSQNADGTTDDTATIYPSVAWWNGTLALARAAPMLTRWASHDFSTDWGTRDISQKTPFYDPISYHQGSVWPLFTGWVSLAEYRAGRSLSAYSHLMQNLNLTWDQDLGSATELLSGEFYQPLGRSSSHQMWSSAMIITPLLRGLFGIDWNATTHALKVTPQLPPDWDHARLHNVVLGPALADIWYERARGKLSVRVTTSQPASFCVIGSTDPCKPTAESQHTLTFPLPAIEVGMPGTPPQQGAQTNRLKALFQDYQPRQATFTFEAQAGSTHDLPLRVNRQHVAARGAEIMNGKLHIVFPSGMGYVQRTVTFVW